MNGFQLRPPKGKDRFIRFLKSSGAVFVTVIILLGMLLPTVRPLAASLNQDTNPSAKAIELLAKLTPEERVGQLFLVTFKGLDVSENTAIYRLISNYHIGGVVLLAENDNFTAGEDALNQIVTLTSELQNNRWNAATNPPSDLFSIEGQTGPHFIPLFIGISPEGDGYPEAQLLYGVTNLPNQMAIGATWNPDLAEQVGETLGRELSALGFNLLLGPSLDVLERPQLDGGSDLGTRTFGGDPFWVGELGRAYIRGVHTGSMNRMAIVAKHFPGNGGADRLPEEEVATVRKSLEQLKNFDLAPFFAVTGEATTPESTVEALLTSHIRYQGFQENIRATTRPVSFDPQAFNLLMGLPQITSWRENGGIMISDNLGSQAVRRFYELTGQVFEARRVAINAFLAGNDLLYIGDVSNDVEPDSDAEIMRTLEFFAQKYREDPAFAQRVDEAVTRILTLKYRLYPAFNLSTVTLDPESVENVGQATQISFEVAQQAATLISPSITELDDTFPDPPNYNDRIVIFSDTRVIQQCSQCPEHPILETQTFRQAILRLYGPQAGGLVAPYNLSAYSYNDLRLVLDASPDITQVESDLRRAHWVVFAMLNVSHDIPNSLVLQRFLSERPDLFQQKRLIVFAFNAPYYLDATNISKITAYYGLYSHEPNFIDVAARLLFRELRPTGALPVSVPGIGYDLISATSPNPDQIIPLFLDLPETGSTEVTPPTSETSSPPNFRVGDLVPVRTGVILDHNGHPVPDGTPVNFIISIAGELTSLPQPVTTVGGIARSTIQVTNSGSLEIRVESEPAKQSTVLQFDIPAEIQPTATHTATPAPTTPTPTLTPTLEVVVTPPADLPAPKRPNLIDWFMASMLATTAGLVTYRLGARIGQIRWGVRGGFLALIGGLLAYSYLAIDLPGAKTVLFNYSSWGIFLITLAGSIAGIISTWIWRSIQNVLRSR